ncbi:hypothetical protein DPEC_G00320290 [Dallia pectoralis]|uniref:Uncharacterized protein n=1 Tax=Dallia pectoralis TaxID=75939 RepID=A0ACC2F9P9_DALPE|nr:hypothetical protein DPEC_G00320290 [Dallia pectoralis]
MAHYTEESSLYAGDRWENTWKSQLDHVVRRDFGCGVMKPACSESSEEGNTTWSAGLNVSPADNAAIEPDKMLDEMRLRNQALLERFNEVEEDRRRAEWTGSALMPESTKLVTTSYSASTTSRLDRWERLSVTVMNQDNSRSVANESGLGRRQPKSRRIQDRLEKSEEEVDCVVEEVRQQIICTIDNSEDAGGYSSDQSNSTSDVERREYQRWKKWHARSSVDLPHKHEEDLSVCLRRGREQRRKKAR